MMVRSNIFAVFFDQISRKDCSQGRTIIYALEHFINRQIKKDDIVISYHSLVYGEIIKRHIGKIGFYMDSRSERNILFI